MSDKAVTASMDTIMDQQHGVIEQLLTSKKNPFLDTIPREMYEEIQRLREALKPFADFAEHCANEHPGWDHDGFTVDVRLTESCGFPKMDAFRRARAALSPPTPSTNVLGKEGSS